jgi:hypothetical protein
MRKFAVLAAAFALLSSLVSPMKAQVINAGVGGTVSDPSGALVPKVTVRATNTSFGRITAAAASRLITFYARFDF